MVLHLAHHKSYHPYNRDNIERVRKDEEAARKAEEAADALLMRTDAEARLEAMRNKANGSKTLSDIAVHATDSTSSVAGKKRKRGREADPGEEELDRQLAGRGWSASIARGTSVQAEAEESRATIVRPAALQETQEFNGHINFWAAEEKGIKPKDAGVGNAEYLADKKKADEKWEEQITMYLGRPASELKPWYGQRDLKNGQEHKRTADQLLEAAYKDGELKKMVDPLSLMSSYLDKKEQVARYNELQNNRRSSGRYSETPTPHAALLADPSVPLLRKRPKRGEEPAYKSYKREASPVSRRQNADSESEDEYLPSRPLRQTIALSKEDEDLKRRQSLHSQTEARENSEKARAAALKKAAKLKRLKDSASSASSAASTPAHSEYGYHNLFNKQEVREARHSRQQFRVGVGRDGRAREGRGWQQTRWDDDR